MPGAKGSGLLMSKGPRLGIDAQNDEVFCFSDILSGLLFRVRVRDGDGDGSRVRVRASVRARWGLRFIHHNPNLLELRLRPGVKT